MSKHKPETANAQERGGEENVYLSLEGLVTCFLSPLSQMCAWLVTCSGVRGGGERTHVGEQALPLVWIAELERLGHPPTHT